MRIFLIVLVVAVFNGPATAQSADEDEAALRSLWNRFEQHFESGDAEGIASLYAADADRFERGADQRVVGRARIQEQYRKVLARRDSNPAAIRPYHAEITIRLLRPDVAILDGVAVPAPGIRSHFTLIAAKEHGQWWFAAGRPTYIVRK